MLHVIRNAPRKSDDVLNDEVDYLPKPTHLSAFYTLNHQALSGRNVNYKYVDFPKAFAFHPATKTWRARKCQTPSLKSASIGRLPFIHPNAGDVFYLRMLLGHAQSKGAKSEKHLRTVNGCEYSTCREACGALRLLQSDTEWEQCLDEASLYLAAPAFRDLFLIIITTNYPADVPSIFYNFHLNLIDDYYMRFLAAEINVCNNNDLLSVAILVMRQLAAKMTSYEDIERFRLPAITPAANERAQRLLNELENLEIQEGATNNHDANHDSDINDLAQQYDNMNDAQRQFTDHVLDSVREGRQFLGVFDAAAGTGKTFTLN
ncbi:MAG: hypothetical protein ACREOZ_05130, partial [Gloeomargaritales cyanobacterium]